MCALVDSWCFFIFSDKCFISVTPVTVHAVSVPAVLKSKNVNQKTAFTWLHPACQACVTHRRQKLRKAPRYAVRFSAPMFINWSVHTGSHEPRPACDLHWWFWYLLNFSCSHRVIIILLLLCSVHWRMATNVSSYNTSTHFLRLSNKMQGSII